MLCFGHRGARGHAPENTVLSVMTAIELGADWVEVDVYAVEDELVCIHDDRLERTTNGTGFVAERSFAYLRSLDAGRGQPIPTLAEIFDAVGRRVGVNVELKGPGVGAPVAAFARDRIERGWSPDGILLSSFDHAELQRLRASDPSLRRGALIDTTSSDAAFAEAVGAHAVHSSIEVVDEGLVTDAHRRGLRVFVYTVNDPAELERMRSIGVDGVFTDFPEIMGRGGSPSPSR